VAKAILRKTKNQTMYQKRIKKFQDQKYIPHSKIPPFDRKTLMGEGKITNEFNDFLK